MCCAGLIKQVDLCPDCPIYVSHYLCIDCPFGLVGVGQALHFLETHCSPCTHAPKHLSC